MTSHDLVKFNWGTASVSPRRVNDFSYVAGINHECYLVVQSMVCSMEYYFVVQSSTGARNSTGVVLCSTLWYWSSAL